ncbi:MAG: sialate O-acetylesterase [Verrucomicrobiota bacterium]
MVFLKPGLPLLFFSVLFGETLRAAEVALPNWVSDHMVIQTDQPLVISGRVSPVAESVELAIGDHRVVATPSLFGAWTAELPPVTEPGGSHTMEFSVEGEVVETVSNVTYGDVWLCGGQSNMEWDMTTVNDSVAEMAAAEYPEIRLMEVQKTTDSRPQKEVKRIEQAWIPCSPASVRNFSAVGYFFGREVHQSTGRPIGLIQSAWGGSRIETWIPAEALAANRYGEAIAGRVFGNQQHRPSICYNAMIHGLGEIGLRGVIWYQGESNQDRPEEYRSLHESLITSWRDRWKRPELPFYFVQLANYGPGRNWELLREAQTRTLALPYTGMAVTIDIGASNDIHPRNKQGTGYRLAAAALAQTYGEDREFSGPVVKSVELEGSNLILSFDHIGSGLISLAGSDSLAGFEVLSSTGNWSRAPAKIDGDRVVVPGTIFRPNPQGVRYAWDSDPEASLANIEGFPARPFRWEEGTTDYHAWKDQLVGRGLRMPEDDTDGDGISNLIAYASVGSEPELVRAKETLIVSFARRAGVTDLQSLIERSTDLKNWTPVWVEGELETSVSISQVWGVTYLDRFAIPVEVEGDAEAYYRVRHRLIEESF